MLSSRISHLAMEYMPRGTRTEYSVCHMRNVHVYARLISHSIIGANTFFSHHFLISCNEISNGPTTNSLYIYCRLQRLVPLILIFTQWGTDFGEGVDPKSICSFSSKSKQKYILVFFEVMKASIDILQFDVGRQITILAKICLNNVQQK